MKKLLRHNIWMLIGMLIVIGGCSLGGPLRKDPKAAGYSVGKLGSQWVRRSDDEGIDEIYQHSENGSFISMSSVCGRYQDVPLEMLDRDLVNPIRSREVLAHEIRLVDGRDATFKKVRGTLDGVPVEAWFVALLKDGCLFDFSLVAEDHLPESAEKDFKSFVDGFHFGGQRQ